ncbi:nucleotidyltransferase family protein [Rheinheimera mangrovi]|uniref:nucleotidyltransferase family protein n=1 Tax=Rheinheimera mangrovi TaxID=2498451 RepID=UPI003899E38B
MENKGIKPSVALATYREEIRQVVAAHHARNVRVFGSVLQGTDTEQSDLDLLVDPTPEMTMLDIGAIRHKLLKLLKVQVDVLTPNALPEKFRSAVLAKARLI